MRFFPGIAVGLYGKLLRKRFCPNGGEHTEYNQESQHPNNAFFHVIQIFSVNGRINGFIILKSVKIQYGNANRRFSGLHPILLLSGNVYISLIMKSVTLIIVNFQEENGKSRNDSEPRFSSFRKKSFHPCCESTKEAVKRIDLPLEVEYITDMERIMEYGLVRIPVLMVSEKIVSMGKISKTAETEKRLKG